MASLYDRVGGRAWFTALVDRFYDRVAADPVLRPVYPEDLAEPRRHLALFLVQRWGGPADFDAERGAPRLRQRHFPFAIGVPERDAWFRHMSSAVREAGLPAEVEQELIDYFDAAATALINQPIPPVNPRGRLVPGEL